jgi:hypothetical protein
MTSHSRLFLICAAFGLISAGASAASNQPVAGTYLSMATFTSVTGCPPGIFTVGQTGSGYFTYPGPGKTGATTRVIASSSSGSVVTVIAYAGKTPAAGNKTWSTSGIDTDEPAGDSHTLTSKTTFTFVDSHSFLAEQRIDWNIGGFPKCTTKSTQAAVYTGQ